MPDIMGTLYIVGTPIGNLEDISFRALRILKEVDLIAAEDTRHSMRLLTHFDIHTKMTAYHKFNENGAAERLCSYLKEGKNIALISDAGMPVISDPGYCLIKQCHDEGIPVTVVPGPNAALSAVVLSGMDCRHFTFIGFIDKSNKALKKGIEDIIASPCPVVVYESPHRLMKFLSLLSEQIPDRPMSISREITKQYEETLNGMVTQMQQHFEANAPKGEFVLVIDGRQDNEDTAHGFAMSDKDHFSESIAEHFEQYTTRGLSEKDAMKAVAKDRGISRREVYQLLKVKENE